MSDKLFIVDRFEGDYVVIEYGRKTFTLPKEILPQGINEKDVIDITIKVNSLETEKRQKLIMNILKKIRTDD
ncbi:MAG TPA: DUF3006 domain-containing protein [Haloplasmataceae bacterium]